ncbi:MAG: DUF4276 family protein [Bacteroidales bacterium]|nr:DUF4276 family protein [Bacteroidales bacterium]MCF8457199.1 DUF4276 family protein [Bacteroidales bacterium]
MVKVGFITEGKADKFIISSDRFKKYLLTSYQIVFSDDDIKLGNGKSGIKKNFKSLLSGLYKNNVDFIIIMVDQDDKETQKKNRKYKPVDCPKLIVDEIVNFRDNRHYVKENLIFVVMTREMEAWFLADEELSLDCNNQKPEEILNPSDVIAKQLGTHSHGRIAIKVKGKFSIERAAKNAPSAFRFIKKLKEIRDSVK